MDNFQMKINKFTTVVLKWNRYKQQHHGWHGGNGSDDSIAEIQ